MKVSSYNHACVTYIDILGFKHLVETVYKDDPAPIDAILDRFSREQNTTYGAGLFEQLISHKPTSVLSFSDSIFRITDLPAIETDSKLRVVELSDNTKETATIISREINVLRKIQHSLATTTTPHSSNDYPGIFIRGGFTIGRISFDSDKSRVFGPAVNKSVSLEAGTVDKPNKNPIIVIDADCIRTFDNLFSELSKSGAVAKDEEGRLFIDYFTPELLSRIARGSSLFY